MVLVLLSACGPSAPAQVGGGDTLVIATEVDPPSLHPFNHQNTQSNWVNRFTFATLLRFDPDTLAPTPNLVSGWSLISDTEWEFTLHPGIRFHNGETMTSADVQASIAYAQTFPEATAATSLVQEVVIVDDLTFRIITNEPSFLLPSHMATGYYSVLPRSLIEAGHDFQAEPIGAGPFRQVEYVLGERIVYEAFEDFFDPERAPRIPNVIYRFIPEDAARTIALETGEVHFLQTVNTADLPRLQGDDAIEVQTRTGLQLHFLALNHEHTDIHFDNAIVRQAIDMAIYKPDIVQAFANGFATPTYNQVHENVIGTSFEHINHFDPEGARALLAEAGIDPSEIRFQINVNNDGWRRIAEVIQAQLAQIGITVTNIEQLDMATHVTRVNGGDFQAAQTSIVLMGTHGIYMIEMVAHSNQIGGFNRSRVNNPDFDRMIETAMSTADEALATRISEELSAELNAMTLHIPLLLFDVIKAHTANLVVPEIDATGQVNFEMVYWR